MSVSQIQRRGRLLQAVVVACCLFAGLLLLVGVVITFAQASAGCTLMTGRSISATSNGWSLSLESTKDTTTIRTSGRKIVVAPNFVQIDGQRVANIDPAIKLIDVRVARGGVTVIGDDQEISTFLR